MIRAMIGTVAVLAGFAVVERSVDASTGQAGSCTPTDAYALLPQGEIAPVAADPKLDAAVVGALRGRVVVTMSGSHGGWARISLPESPQIHGWVPADLLRVEARANGPLSLYDRPGPLGHKLATLDGEAGSFRVLGCRGSWLHVVNARTGAVWIDKTRY